jgi:hypothetical protein
MMGTKMPFHRWGVRDPASVDRFLKDNTFQTMDLPGHQE